VEKGGNIFRAKCKRRIFHFLLGGGEVGRKGVQLSYGKRKKKRDVPPPTRKGIRSSGEKKGQAIHLWAKKVKKKRGVRLSVEQILPFKFDKKRGGEKKKGMQPSAGKGFTRSAENRLIP